MTRRWLNSADVEIDEATGALLVKVGNADEGDNLATIAAALAGPYRVNEGGTPKATTDANPVDVLTVGTGHTIYHCRYANGPVAGLISFDDGTTWEYLPANAVGVVDGIKLAAGQKVQIKRIGDSDMNGVYAAAWGI